MEAALEQLVDDALDYWIPPGGVVPRVERPTALEFQRDYVALNKPVILTGIIPNHISDEFTEENLCRWSGDRRVRINLTPDGRGDSVVDGVFVKPAVREMTLRELFDGRETGVVRYLSEQNDNLRKEFPELLAKVEHSLELGKLAFGNESDAVNLWIGWDDAISSMHKDHYENLYSVMKGEKEFHLLPPCAQPFLKEKEFPQAHYNFDGSQWTIEMEHDSDKVTWSELDPANLAAWESDRLTSKAASLICHCKVRQGEILYLPSMWYHRVTQTSLTIAVNYWHDMQFDSRWVYANFLERCTKLVRNS